MAEVKESNSTFVRFPSWPEVWPECNEDSASCDCCYHENMRAAEASHGGDEQLSMPEIPPPPPPAEYLRAQVREAHALLSRLHTIFGQQMPNNVYMAMAYLHVEIATGDKGGAHVSGQ